MDMIPEILISAFLIIGGIFGLVGSYGLIKLPSAMARLHAPTKSTTLGVGGVLIASMLHFFFVQGDFSFHELLVTLFLFLTAPITAHFIAKAHLHNVVDRNDLPPTQTDADWAGLAVARGRETPGRPLAPQPIRPEDAEDED